MQSEPMIIGVDVAKDDLQLAVHAGSTASRRLPNQAQAIQDWLATLSPGSVVAMEATGKYHALLAELAHLAGMQVYVLNARDVYFYAKALGTRGKTDRLDAQVFARYAAEHRATLRSWHPAPELLEQLQEMLKRRRMLTDQSVTVRLSLRGVKQLQAVNELLEQAFTSALDKLDAQVMALVHSDQQLSSDVARLQTITGFGMQASVLLAALFNRIEFDNADAVVAYSGLDPRPCDSGTKHGKRRLSKRGPGILRRAMYLAAFAACHSKALGSVYQALRAKGFATTESLIILARKLLRIAWAVWRNGKTFDASLVGAQHACIKT